MHLLTAGIFWVVFAVTATAIAYLFTLTLASFFTPIRVKGYGLGLKRFAVLVPAHDEEAVIGTLLESLRGLDYPRDHFSVFVVADNCSDATASLARAGGARVFERFDAERRGKGYALGWLLKQIAALPETYDAFVIVDADSRLSPGFLRAMEGELARGRQVLQGYDSVLNPEDGVGAALRYAAMTLINVVRPLGKNTLGFSTGLKGNGMCLAASVLQKYGWNTYSLAEDAEYGVRLLLDGVRGRFVPAAQVWAQMPPAVRQGGSQNVRWETGRLIIARRYAPRLLGLGLRRRDPVFLDAALELLIPPLSLLVSAVTLLAAAAWLLPFLSSARPVVALIAGALAMHVLVGLARVGVPTPVWRSLLHAPFYCLWKLALYLRALLFRAPSAWVRTRRFS